MIKSCLKISTELSGTLSAHVCLASLLLWNILCSTVQFTTQLIRAVRLDFLLWEQVEKEVRTYAGLRDNTLLHTVSVLEPRSIVLIRSLDQSSIAPDLLYHE